MLENYIFIRREMHINQRIAMTKSSRKVGTRGDTGKSKLFMQLQSEV